MPEICKTDIQNIERLLSKCAEIIEKYAVSTREQDLARRARKMSKKLKKNFNNETNR